MIDIHTHLLPGADDGSASIEESIQMIKTAYESGVRSLAVTPHCNHPGHERNYYGQWYEQAFGMLKEAVCKKLPVKLYTGMEIFLTPEVPELIARKKLITINNSNYMLVEFHADESSKNVLLMVNSLLKLNLIPVIAHPERYEFIAGDADLPDALVESGCILQINKGSILGRFGHSVRKISLRMLSRGLAHVVASDAHSPYQRTTYMADAYDYVCAHYGQNYAKLLFDTNPARIIDNESII